MSSDILLDNIIELLGWLPDINQDRVERFGWIIRKKHIGISMNHMHKIIHYTHTINYWTHHYPFQKNLIHTSPKSNDDDIFRNVSILLTRTDEYYNVVKIYYIIHMLLSNKPDVLQLIYPYLPMEHSNYQNNTIRTYFSKTNIKSLYTLFHIKQKGGKTRKRIVRKKRKRTKKI
jgi:hypothetical protein